MVKIFLVFLFKEGLSVRHGFGIRTAVWSPCSVFMAEHFAIMLLCRILTNFAVFILYFFKLEQFCIVIIAC